MTKLGLVAILMVVGLCAGQAMATATIYLSTDALNGTVPSPATPTSRLIRGRPSHFTCGHRWPPPTARPWASNLEPTNPAILSHGPGPSRIPLCRFDPDFPG